MGPKATGIVGALLGYPAHSATPATQRRPGSDRYQPPAAVQTAQPAITAAALPIPALIPSAPWPLLFGGGQHRSACGSGLPIADEA